MSRDIEFRAWDTTRHEFFSSRELKDKSLWWTVFDGGIDVTSALKYPIGIELMQYTGLNDKNGVEIYEGDIVVDTRDKKKLVHEIRWYRGGFMRHTAGHFGFKDIETYDGDCMYFEVIGNIYESPELLKAGA